MATKSLIVLAGLLAFEASAQQAATPQQTQPTEATPSQTPCKNPAPTPPHKQGWLEKKARDLACKQNAGMCNLPSSPDEAIGTTPAAKPCAETPAPKAPAPPAAPIPPTPNARPALVCPPKTVLITGTAYCLTADHTTVDAIPLPPNQQIPAAPQK